MMVEIDDDAADAIVVANVAWAYVNLSESIKNPKQWHEDDVEHWKQLIPALKLVGEWYSVDFNAAIKKAKKQK